MQETTEELPTPPKAKALGNGKKRSTLERLLSRVTENENGAGGSIRRRRILFTIDPSICAPGAFDDPFELLLESPSAEQELAAAKACGGEQGAMIFILIKSCIVSVDGEKVRDGDLTRDAVWEALSTVGRGLVVAKWQELNGLGAEAKKKVDDSTKLLVG